MIILGRKGMLKVLSRSLSVLRGNATRKGDDKERLHIFLLSECVHHVTLIYQYIVCLFSTLEKSSKYEKKKGSISTSVFSNMSRFNWRFKNPLSTPTPDSADRQSCLRSSSGNEGWHHQIALQATGIAWSSSGSVG